MQTENQRTIIPTTSGGSPSGLPSPSTFSTNYSTYGAVNTSNDANMSIPPGNGYHQYHYNVNQSAVDVNNARTCEPKVELNDDNSLIRSIPPVDKFSETTYKTNPNVNLIPVHPDAQGFETKTDVDVTSCVSNGEKEVKYRDEDRIKLAIAMDKCGNAEKTHKRWTPKKRQVDSPLSVFFVTAEGKAYIVERICDAEEVLPGLNERRYQNSIIFGIQFETNKGLASGKVVQLSENHPEKLQELMLRYGIYPTSSISDNIMECNLSSKPLTISKTNPNINLISAQLDAQRFETKMKAGSNGEMEIKCKEDQNMIKLASMMHKLENVTYAAESDLSCLFGATTEEMSVYTASVPFGIVKQEEKELYESSTKVKTSTSLNLQAEPAAACLESSLPSYKEVVVQDVSNRPLEVKKDNRRWPLKERQKDSPLSVFFVTVEGKAYIVEGICNAENVLADFDRRRYKDTPIIVAIKFETSKGLASGEVVYMPENHRGKLQELMLGYNICRQSSTSDNLIDCNSANKSLTTSDISPYNSDSQAVVNTTTAVILEKTSSSILQCSLTDERLENRILTPVTLEVITESDHSSKPLEDTVVSTTDRDSQDVVKTTTSTNAAKTLPSESIRKCELTDEFIVEKLSQILTKKDNRRWPNSCLSKSSPWSVRYLLEGEPKAITVEGVVMVEAVLESWDIRKKNPKKVLAAYIYETAKGPSSGKVAYVSPLRREKLKEILDSVDLNAPVRAIM
jgi:hypothetical protein